MQDFQWTSYFLWKKGWPVDSQANNMQMGYAGA
jgi:hypothetical protein